MTDLRVYAKQNSVPRKNDDSWVALRGLRDGSPIVMPWYQALVLEGRAYAVSASLVSVEIATSAYADTLKELFVDIPDGTAAIPLKVEGSFAVVDGTLNEAYAFVSLTLNGTGGTETALTPRNMRVDNPSASGATAAHTASAAVDTVTGTEIFLTTHGPVTLDMGGVNMSQKLLDWSIGLHDHAPVMMDASSLNVVLHDPNVGTGRADAAWAEFPESVFAP